MKEAPRTISRRKFLQRSSALLGASVINAACGGGSESTTPTATTVKPTETARTAVSTPTKLATQVPTEVPTTPKPELLLFPEKYNFGANDEYFRQYEGGLFTGVEKGRAEETHISYVSPWDKSGPTFDVEQEVIKGLEVNDPAALEKALWISEELRKSMIEKTDDNGVLTVEDFDRANAKYDALVVEGNTPVSGSSHCE